ncbi:MAG: hypothetical protein KKD69_07400 [Euryarchaeota archaeon]|nr:hypothetical protein [Euryarchaeota archaeon]
MELEIAPHVEEIKRALDNEIDEGNIIAELKKLLEYRVPLSEAKRSLIKKYGGGEKSKARKLKDIVIGDRNIEITGQILEISKKTINVKNTEKIVFSGDGDINVHTEFTILNIEPHDINTKDGTKKILSGIAADEDTRLPFTAWIILPELAAGSAVEVKNAYVRSFRRIPALNINENSIVTKLDKKLEYKGTSRVRIGDIVSKDGAYDIVIEGNILSVRPGSGLIARCPECSRVIKKGICRVHSKVDEKIDMRIKAIIDDGTGALTLVLDAPLTQKICGYTIEEAQNIAKAAMSQEAVEDEIKKKLVGKMLAARGNTSKGDFGITLVASDVWEPSDSTREKAIELLGRAG